MWKGVLIASGSRLSVPEQSWLRRWLGSNGTEFCDANGNALYKVTSDGRNHRFLSVTSRDGCELGSVALRGKDRGSIRAEGEIVGSGRIP